MSVVTAPDMPWLMQEAIDWLDSIMRPYYEVLETGAGASTIFLARRAKMVISFEHDEEWYRTVNRKLKAENLPCVLTFDPNYPANGLGNLARRFDLALIDGRGRNRSVSDGLLALLPGGWLVLDDSDRERYAPSRQLMDSLSSCKIVFRSGPDETTAWRKRKD